jgi:hypothetical protein
VQAGPARGRYGCVCLHWFINDVFPTLRVAREEARAEKYQSAVSVCSVVDA